MMPMTLAQVAQSVGGKLVFPDVQRAGGPVGALGEQVVSRPPVSDSRQVTPGSLFVAIDGERVDGHDFVRRAGQTGACGALVGHEVPEAGIVQIVVDDTIRALGLLARRNLDLRRALGTEFSVVGITGSVGKTTTKDLLGNLLSALGPTVAPVGSFNNDIGLPLTALRVDETTRYLIAEMGANHVGEIADLTRIAPPDLSVVLKVGSAHLGEFGSVERIAQAKSEIVQGLSAHGVAVLNADDARVASMRRFAPGKVLWFGAGDCRYAQGGGDLLEARDIRLDALDRPSFTLHASDGEARVSLAIPGGHNVSNALAAASVARCFGMSFDEIAAGLHEVAHISPHRMAVSAVSRSGSHFTLIDDSFNANPDSMRAGLDGLAKWEELAEPSPFRVAVLGAMLELGDDDVRLHREIGAYAAGLGLDAVVAVGGEADAHLDELAGALAQGVRDGGGNTGVPTVRLVHNTDEADEAVCRLARGRDDVVVLLKGSHVSGLSALAERWS